MDIRLYIGDRQVDLSNNVDILFNWQETDLSNPTIIKNGYSKTIVIEGTNNNNDIFGHFWNLERYQSYGGNTGVDYNPSYRVPFTLYYNGAIYERGYVKLQKVTKLDKEYKYEIGLFGGLGSFIYNLSTDWNTGGKRALSSLTYYKWPESTEPFDLSFKINKETVASAWTEVNTNNKFGCINFAPTYNGLPTNLDADKVLINFSGASLFSSTTVDSKTYKAYRGYALGQLPDKLTAEEVKDYRSYLQTPVIRVKSIFEAICRKENNKGKYDEGYEVVLDNDFFNPSNPYYWDTWLTLDKMSLIPSGTKSDSEIVIDTTPVYTYNNSTGLNLAFAVNSSGKTGTIKASFKLRVNIPNATSDELHLSATNRVFDIIKFDDYPEYEVIAIQAYTSNSKTPNQNIMTASKLQWITESIVPNYYVKLQGPTYLSYEEANKNSKIHFDFVNDWLQIDTYGVENYDGYFVKVSNGIYEFNKPIEFEIDYPSSANYLKIRINNHWWHTVGAESAMGNYTHLSVLSSTQNLKNATLYQFNRAQLSLYDSDFDFNAIESNNEYSNREISQDILLNTSFTPAEFLVSYCKTFGLYLYKDTVEDKIYISTRNNFFKKEDILNLEDILDVSKGVEINPIYVDTNYVALTNKPVEGASYSDYSIKYGKPFGTKVVNTGYEFNADIKELLDGIVFKNAIQSKEQSQYFYKKTTLNPYVFNGFSYSLYENGDYDAESTDIEIPKKEISQMFEPYDETYPYYDMMSKAQFEDSSHKGLDTEGILLFYNGMFKAPSGYYLTDDNSYMTFLNNNPCWIMTDNEYDSNGNRIAIKANYIPRFSRYFEGNHWMIYSMDFGSPRELYVPDMTNNEEANIYYNYHKKYYEDLYDINTRVVTCYVKTDYLTEESLRNIYWFRNGLWRLNRVFDYNPASPNTTKCEFIKIQDLGNLSNEDATSNLRIRITLDRYEIGASGGTIIGTVWTSDNYGWSIENVGYNPAGGSEVTISPETYGQSGNFTVTVPSNGGPAREVTIYVTAGDIGGNVSFIQEGYGDYITLTAVSPIAATATTLNYTVSCSDSCRVRLTGSLIPTFIQNDHPSGVTNGSFTIPANTESYEQYYSLLAWDIYNVSISAATSVEQLGASGRTLTGITLDAAWATDVPASGGTASYENCNYTVTAHYSDNTTADVTSQAIMSASTTLNVPATSSTTRENVGTISVIAFYYDGPNPFSATKVVNVWQAANDSPVPPTPTSGVGEYLTFEIISGGTIYWRTEGNRYQKTIQYSINDGQWYQRTSSTGGTSISVNSGDIVKFRGNNAEYNHNAFESYDVNFNLWGNIMSLIDSTNFSGLTTLSSANTFNSLFEGVGGLISIENLSMPATTLSDFCYANMFGFCTGLKSVSSDLLPATTLSESCYNNMFYGCTSLTTPPDLLATTLAKGCYRSMFGGCSNLNYIRCLATDISASACTDFWVQNVASAGTFVKSSGMTGWTIDSVNGVPIGWTVINDGQVYTWQAYNRSEWNVYGNLLTGNTEAYDGLETLSGETENHYSTVPSTITSAYLALSTAPSNPSDYKILLSTSTHGDSMICTYNGSAWVGTGSLRLEQGTILDVAVGQV